MVEGRAGTVVEVRDHDLDRDDGPDDARRRNRPAGEPPAPPHRVPDAEPRDDERDLLARQRCEQREQGERLQAVLVEVPDREEQQRTGQRDGVELVQRHPLGRRKEEVGERETKRHVLRVVVLASEPEQRQRPERNDDRLCCQEQARTRPEPPERREDDEDRIDVRGEAGDLRAVQVRDLEEMAVRGRPDGLNHVAEVEAPGFERAVAEHGERRGARRICGHRRPEERPGGGPRAQVHHHSVRSRRSRQRCPRTRSEACRS